MIIGKTSSKQEQDFGRCEAVAVMPWVGPEADMLTLDSAWRGSNWALAKLNSSPCSRSMVALPGVAARMLGDNGDRRAAWPIFCSGSKIQGKERRDGRHSANVYLASHPATAERIDALGGLLAAWER